MRTSRQSPFAQRIEQQQKRLNRIYQQQLLDHSHKAEKFENTVDWKNKHIRTEAYETFLKNEIAQ